MYRKERTFLMVEKKTREGLSLMIMGAIEGAVIIFSSLRHSRGKKGKGHCLPHSPKSGRTHLAWNCWTLAAAPQELEIQDSPLFTSGSRIPATH